MATDVVMPQMGESIAEGTITKWLVEVGQRVERDQPLFEISTDKVDAEIPSPASGVLVEILHSAGTTVPVHQIVARIEEGVAATATPAPAATPVAAPAPPPVAPEAAATAASLPAPSPSAPGSEEERVRRYSSPLVRKMAREHGIDLSQVSGSGLHGRVTKEDLLKYLERKPAAAATAPAASVVPPKPATMPSAVAVPVPGFAKIDTGFHVPAYVEGEPVRIEPMTKIRQITAAHMRYSKDTSAHVTTVFEMDMTRVHNARQRAKDKFLAANGTKLTYMPFIFKAVCEALKQNPKLNASIDGTNIVYKLEINLGMAVALDWGLIVPVIRNADQLNLVGLAKAANDLADRARSKKLSPDETKRGTFSITNPGVFGSLFGTPIISQPQVAILGIGAIEKRPVVMTDADGCDTIAIRVMSYFGITYDHRLVDGADADHFMNAVKRSLESGQWPELEPYS